MRYEANSKALNEVHLMMIPELSFPTKKDRIKLKSGTEHKFEIVGEIVSGQLTDAFSKKSKGVFINFGLETIKVLFDSSIKLTGIWDDRFYMSTTPDQLISDPIYFKVK